MDESTQYCKETVENEEKRIQTCEPQLLAFQRHLDDLEKPHLRWNEAMPNRIRNFAKLFKYPEGLKAGQVVDLHPFQVFQLSSVFGWERYDKEAKEWVRRFNKGLIFKPRKNAKTFTWTLGELFEMTTKPQEKGTNIFNVAWTEDQAKIIYNFMVEMIRDSKIRHFFTPLSDEIRGNGEALPNLTNSRFKCLPCNPAGTEGRNADMVVVDEFHTFNAKKGIPFYNSVKNAQSARKDPLLIIVTTAGDPNLVPLDESICYQEMLHAEDVLKTQDPRYDDFFALITRADKSDLEKDEFGVWGWTKESVWFKANQMLDVSKKKSDLKKLIKDALRSDQHRLDFITKQLNMYISARPDWISGEEFAKLEKSYTEKELMDCPCWIGIDLGASKDLTCVALVFQMPDKTFHIVPKYYLAEKQLQEHAIKRPKYLEWSNGKWFTTTSGNVTDQQRILQDVYEFTRTYDVRDIRMDPWLADMLESHLDQMDIDYTVVEQKHGYISNSIKFIERMFFDKRLTFNGNPILPWNFSNCVLDVDNNDNYKLAKRSENEKKDGCDAIVNCFTEILHLTEEDEDDDERSAFFTL